MNGTSERVSEPFIKGQAIRMESRRKAGAGPARKLEMIVPRAGRATMADERVITKQIGREVRGEVLVARRCPHGLPAVTVNLPCEPADGGTIPPLLWLTCPYLKTRVAGLESEGWVAEYARMVESEPEFRTVFLSEEERFAAMYIELAESVCGEGFSRRLGGKGIAGGAPGAVKCLHAHLAFHLSSGGGVLGERVMGLLSDSSEAWCEEPPEACLY